MAKDTHTSDTIAAAFPAIDRCIELHRRPNTLLFPTVCVCGSTFLQFTANLTPSDCRRHDAMCWSCDNENKGHTWKAHMHDMSQPIGRLGTAAERFGMRTPLELVHAQHSNEPQATPCCSPFCNTMTPGMGPQNPRRGLASCHTIRACFRFTGATCRDRARARVSVRNSRVIVRHQNLKKNRIDSFIVVAIAW